MTDEAIRLYNEASDKVRSIVDMYLALSESERELFDNLFATETAE